METTISQRLTEFMRYSGESQVSLSKKIGAPQSSIATIISRNTGLNSGTIEKLYIAFPILSIDWLITGNGSMLKSDQPASIDPTLIAELKEEINDLKSENNQLKGENKILRELAGLAERKESKSKSA